MKKKSVNLTNKNFMNFLKAKYYTWLFFLKEYKIKQIKCRRMEQEEKVLIVMMELQEGYQDFYGKKKDGAKQRVLTIKIRILGV